MVKVNDYYKANKIFKDIYSSLKINSIPVIKQVDGSTDFVTNMVNNLVSELVVTMIMSAASLICLMTTMNYFIFKNEQYQTTLLLLNGYNPRKVLKKIYIISLLVFIPSLIFVIISFSYIKLILLIVIFLIQYLIIRFTIYRKINNNISSCLKGR
jgi:hypothetical protein